MGRRIEVRDCIGSRRLDVYVLTDRDDATYIERCKEGGMVTLELFAKEGERPADMSPSFSIPLQLASQLVEKLSTAGFMPGETAQMHGQLKATKKHLKDMRGLVEKFGTLLEEGCRVVGPEPKIEIRTRDA